MKEKGKIRDFRTVFRVFPYLPFETRMRLFRKKGDNSASNSDLPVLRNITITVVVNKKSLTGTFEILCSMQPAFVVRSPPKSSHTR